MKFPEKVFIGSTAQCTISYGLDTQVQSHLRKDLRTLGCFVLPPFQRPSLWTLAQESKFIESIWLGLPIACYVYNQCPHLGPTDQWLIDGQQRWTAIHHFVENKVPVFDGLHYSDMDERELAGFHLSTFPCIITKSDDPKFLEDIYNRLAYGGTPHKPKKAIKKK